MVEQLPEVTLSIHELLALEFGESSIMLDIARCESGVRQFNVDGSILQGHINNKDIGIFQINEFYHLDRSMALGTDIYTIDGNISYASVLYEEQGTQPWNWSRGCWE